MRRMVPPRFVGSAPPQRTYLMYGVPGNGKTFMARALAGELRMNFLQVSVGHITDKYVFKKLCRQVEPSNMNLIQNYTSKDIIASHKCQSIQALGGK